MKDHVYEEVLADIERSGGTISEEKSEFLKDRVRMVAFVCGWAGRTPDEVKVKKIVDWKLCKLVSEAKGFVGICVYYRIWIKNFAICTDLIYRLTYRKKERDFLWGPEQQAAMDDLKDALTHAPALKLIDYKADGKIILAVDSSLLGWGAILQQEEQLGSKKRHP